MAWRNIRTAEQGGSPHGGRAEPGGRGFNGAVPVRPATSAGHPVPPGTSSCRPPGATAAGATLMYLHDTPIPRWSPQHKAIHNGCHHLETASNAAAGLSRLQHVEAKMLPGSNENLLEKSSLFQNKEMFQHLMKSGKIYSII